MSDLFQPNSAANIVSDEAPTDSNVSRVDMRPLAERMRPATLLDVVGQSHLLAADQPLGRQLAQGRLSSTLLWGPPGCGKTTIARLLADATDMRFDSLSAIFTGVVDLKKAFESARMALSNGRRTLLFVDEIHRFNRSQQDSFLPVVEDGTITLVGATTENPSFELNAALLSRMQVMVLKRLDEVAMTSLIARVQATSGARPALTSEAHHMLMAMADGDGRYLLTMLDQLLNEPQAEGDDQPLNVEQIQRLVTTRAAQYDKGQEAHYNLISALHKSLRGSDVDAALYWYARMIEGGEDPRYIARRLVRFASEDIGMADPNAVVQALTAWQSFERLGSPEGDLNLTQAVVYLATAPKSNGVYAAHKAAARAAKAHGSLTPPPHILNAPTALMKNLGYGDGYAYDHNTDEGFSGQNYFPDEMSRQQFYDPPARGFERDIRKRLEYWQGLRTKKTEGPDK